MDEEITNERLFLEARKNHRRLIAAVAGITVENLLIVSVISGFFDALTAGIILAGILAVTMITAEGMHNGGIWSRVSGKLPLAETPGPEPEIEQRFQEE